MASMRLLKSKNSGNGFGFAKVKIESDEDFWDLYNLILPGDSVRSVTLRKTHREHQQSGSSSVRVHRLVMTLIVKSTEYGGNSLRVSGFNAIDNEYVKMGQHHTMEFRSGSELVLYKRDWDWLSRARLEESCNKKVGTGDDILILLIGSGLANMYVVSSNRTSKLFGVSHSIARGNVAGLGSKPYNDSKNRFFSQIAQSLVSHLSLDEVDSIILGGPGFFKDDFLKYLTDSQGNGNKDLVNLFKQRKHIFITAKTSSVFQQSVDEILLSEELKERLKDTKAFQQVKLLDHMQYLLATKPDYVCYGLKSTEEALEHNAIETLLVSEALARSENLSIRARLSRITETNSRLGGKTCIFSSSHNSGKALESMSGVAAILRFPVESLLDESQEQSSPRTQAKEEFDWFQKEKEDVGAPATSNQAETPDTLPDSLTLHHQDNFLVRLQTDSETINQV